MVPRWTGEAAPARPGTTERLSSKGEGGGGGQGCIRRGRISKAAEEAGRQAVGGSCQSGWGRLLSVTNATEAGTWRQGDSGWA